MNKSGPQEFQAELFPSDVWVDIEETLKKAEETCKELDRMSKLDHIKLLEPFNI